MGTSSSEEKVYKLLEQKYSKPAWAFFRQVRNKTGYADKVRTADAVAVSLWPSRGLEFHGFEIKASRSDWLTELRNPDKAEAVAKYCDQWWLVTTKESYVEPGELPPSWGWMVAEGRKLHVKEKAGQLSAAQLDREFVVSLLRCAHQEIEESKQGMIHRSEIAEQIKEAEQQGRHLAKIELSRDLRRIEQLEQSIDQFEKWSGIQIGEYNGAKMGQLVAMIRGFESAALLVNRIGGIAARMHEAADVMARTSEAAKLELDDLEDWKRATAQTFLDESKKMS